MQEKNNSSQKPPLAGDGTQMSKKPRSDANWFGASQEPQEEFLEQGADDETERWGTRDHQPGPSSEGKPTFGAGAGPRSGNS